MSTQGPTARRQASMGLRELLTGDEPGPRPARPARRLRATVFPLVVGATLGIATVVAMVGR